jgi:acetyl esterase/lipase
VKRIALTIALSSLLLQSATAQEFIPLWPEGMMPNSKGTYLQDSIFNERLFRVATPGVHAFFPAAEENSGCAVLICPGGGYRHETFVRAGFQVAKWLNSLGLTAFVLRYRLPTSPDLLHRETAPLQDAQRAMRLIRRNAQRWQLRADNIGALGSSAGGHLAAALGTIREDLAPDGDSISFTPNFLILISPVITMGAFTHEGSRNSLLGPSPSEELVRKFSIETQVTPASPPSFVVHALDDKVVPVQNSLLFCEACIEQRVPASLHLFPHGGHSIGLRNNPGSTAEWTTLCELWLRESGYLQEPAKKQP